MPQEKNYNCVHEELIQDHSLKIATFEKELSFKKEKLDDLKEDNRRMEEKLDDIKECINEIIHASKKDDDKLDKRLLRIETRLETQEELSRTNRDDFNLKLTIITVIFLALTFYFNYIHHI